MALRAKKTKTRRFAEGNMSIEYLTRKRDQYRAALDSLAELRVCVPLDLDRITLAEALNRAAEIQDEADRCTLSLLMEEKAQADWKKSLKSYAESVKL